MLRKSMDWFLNDRDPSYERVKVSKMLCLNPASIPLHFYKKFKYVIAVEFNIFFKYTFFIRVIKILMRLSALIFWMFSAQNWSYFVLETLPLKFPASICSLFCSYLFTNFSLVVFIKFVLIEKKSVATKGTLTMIFYRLYGKTRYKNNRLFACFVSSLPKKLNSHLK